MELHKSNNTVLVENYSKTKFDEKDCKQKRMCVNCENCKPSKQKGLLNSSKSRLNINKSSVLCINGKNTSCKSCKQGHPSSKVCDYSASFGEPQYCLLDYDLIDNNHIEKRFVLSQAQYLITKCCQETSVSSKPATCRQKVTDSSKCCHSNVKKRTAVNHNHRLDHLTMSSSKPFQSKTCYSYTFKSNLSLTSVFISSLVLFMSLLTSQLVMGFNVDTRTALVQTGQNGSMFGYAVAQHTDQGQHWLLIGAPKQQTDQPGVRQGGAVFRCKVDDVDCHNVPFDIKGNQKPWNGSRRVQIEEKSGQWLGASVFSAGTGGVIVACAPRYVYYTEDRNRREPVGTCYVGMGTTTKFLEYSPCKKALRRADVFSRYRPLPKEDSPYGPKGKGSCQLGFTSALTADGKQLIMGAVGSFYWQGQVFSQDLQGGGDSVVETPQFNNSELHDNSYKGYSMTSGMFSGSKKQDYVVGIPREKLEGRVAVYNSDLDHIASVTGEQMGEYFGYSVGVGDFNGDGLDDLAVGAPFHTDYKSDVYETGRVHVFYQDDMHTFHKERTRIRGTPHSRSRFGFAVTGLKDINRDGYEDLAVGAPYGGTLNQGAVYIFHGSADGIQKEHSQIIHAADISPTLSAFGASLSGGLDQDKNNYPDILVGSYESDSAVFLRSRPIARVTAIVSTTPAVINLDNQLCHIGTGRAKRSVTCFTTSTCLQYIGMRVASRIQLKLQWTLDYGKNRTHRAYFLDSHNITKSKVITLAKKKEKCTTQKCYVKEDIRDKLNPVGIKLSYELVNDPDPPADELLPILDLAAPTYVDSWTQIKKDCGSDDVCIPELDISAYSLVQSHIHGTESDIDIQVTVQNFGEDSYETMLHLALPYGVSYIRVYNIYPENEVKCTTKIKKAGNEIICDVGNPLQTMHMANFTIKTRAKEVNDTEYLTFLFQINSTNPENQVDLSNNHAMVDVPLSAMAEIKLSGVSNPEQILYNRTYLPEVNTDADVGPQVIHLYEVRNEGPSNLSSVSVVINWPTHFIGGYELMYLPVLPQVVRGKGKCEAENINTHNVTITETQQELDENVFNVLKKKLRNRRRKRSVHKRSLWEDDYTVKRLECEAEQVCSVITCEIYDLNKGDNALIQITSRVWIETIIKLQEVYPGLIIRSEAIGQVMEVPYVVKAEEYSIDTFQIESYIAALNQRPRKAPLQFWVIAIAVFCGCLLLLLLILLLWKVGFFHRTSIDDLNAVPVHTGVVEKQPNPETTGTNGVYKYEAIPNDQL